MILNKLNDITMNLNLSQLVDMSSAMAQVYGMVDLVTWQGSRTQLWVWGGKDMVGSLKAPWMGKPQRKKARKDGVALDEDKWECMDGKST